MPKPEEEAIAQEAAQLVQAVHRYAEALRQVNHGLEADPVRVTVTVERLIGSPRYPLASFLHASFRYTTPGEDHAHDPS